MMEDIHLYGLFSDLLIVVDNWVVIWQHQVANTFLQFELKDHWQAREC